MNWLVKWLPAIVIIVGLAFVTYIAFNPEKSAVFFLAFPDLLFLSVLVTFVVTLLVSGKVLAGNWFGAIIDERRRVSLSLFQMWYWSGIILSSVFAIAITNIVFWQQWLQGSAEDPGMSIAPLAFDIPGVLLLLMGLSVSTTIGSTLIKRQQISNPELVKPVRNDDIREARLRDMFMDEMDHGEYRLDLTKVQMFFITVLVGIAYTVNVFALLDIEGMIEAMPMIDGGLIGLLFVSKGGYLVQKSAATKKKDDPDS